MKSTVEEAIPQVADLQRRHEILLAIPNRMPPRDTFYTDWKAVRSRMVWVQSHRVDVASLLRETIHWAEPQTL